ncbi:hypothetical protein B0T24DRAFT_664804 [Lasiosphaeria ovina]|uniref:Uncharacterized protein n=1 Tax=Lasiosphaeria ovina TaxID=92902 RepID=A0AAE0KF82_9PEZI|nr:hypothetical protein B0T24DRAFT_664804 [Lasiosphaeria ovina]
MAILQSCLLRLIACINTVLHLNILSRGGRVYLVFRELRWTVLALLAPELVVFMAADQFQKASRLAKQLKALQEGSSTVDKQAVFDLKFSPYVIMGGLGIKAADLKTLISYEDADVKLADKLRLAVEKNLTITLTAEGIRYLASWDIWVYPSRDLIDEKSKADLLQKTLVLFQVGWMAMQCIVGGPTGFRWRCLRCTPVVHVVCAAIMFVFWAQKPLDVRSPELVFNASWLDTLSVMVQKSFYATRACIWRALELEAMHGPVEEPPEDVASLLGFKNPDSAGKRPFTPLRLSTGSGALGFSKVFDDVYIDGAAALAGGVHRHRHHHPRRLHILFLAVIMSMAAAPALKPTRLSPAERKKLAWNFNYYILAFVGLLAIVLYLAARAFLVVQSFLSLRRVPIGVYWSPAWLQMIPHL